ncbi:hypothetical protein AVEN_79905-1, partial [Araneus ventricosus]
MSNFREQERYWKTTVSDEVVERVRKTSTPQLLIPMLNGVITWNFDTLSENVFEE